MDLSKMTTESRNVSTMNLDQMSPLEIVTAMNREDRSVPAGIEAETGRFDFRSKGRKTAGNLERKTCRIMG